MPFGAFVFQVRTPRDQMPPYTAKVLSDAQLADIYAFVQSQPQPPKADSLPQLK
jgi:mono/diheme cytochrome c family protein